MLRLPRHLFLLCMLMFTGACDTAVIYLPEMRRTPEKQPSMLGEITVNTGIHVLPVEGMAAEPGGALAEAVAEALRNVDIPAHAAQALYGAHRLRMVVDTSAGQGIVHWSLIAPAGDVVSLFDGAQLPADLGANSPQMTQLAQMIAETVSPHLRTPGAPRTFGLAVAVQPIPTAPGDGAQTLPVALRAALRDAGLKLTDPRMTDRARSDVIKVAGKVTLTSVGLAQEDVWISWRVIDPDGAEIGVVDQRNQIPKGQLDGNWGPLAALIADGAKEGILQLVEDYRQSLAEAAEN